MISLSYRVRRRRWRLAAALVVCLARGASADAPSDAARFSLERELPRLEQAIRLSGDAAERVALEMRLDEWRAKLLRGESDEAESRAWLGELARLEISAVDALARRYRLAAYATFAADRASYERCRAAWETVFSTWQRRGAQPDERPALLDWLAAAGAELERRAAPPPLPAWDGSGRSAPAALPEPKPPTPAATVLKRPADPPQAPPTVSRAGDVLLAHPGVAARGTVLPELPPASAVRPPRSLLAGPIAEPSDAATASTSQPRVNLEELGLRITTHNLALRGLEQELQPGAIGDIDRMIAVWDEIRERADRERDLRLFLGALGEAESRLVPELETWMTAGRLLQASLASAQEVLRSDESPAAAADLIRVRRLAAVVAERLANAR